VGTVGSRTDADNDRTRSALQNVRGVARASRRRGALPAYVRLLDHLGTGAVPPRQNSTATTKATQPLRYEDALANAHSIVLSVWVSLCVAAITFVPTAVTGPHRCHGRPVSTVLFKFPLTPLS
jgi:hypothetical protein